MKSSRFFIGVEIVSPWPSDFPSGRLLEVNDRHLTLLFLGNIAFSQTLVESLPMPLSRLGLAGCFDYPVFLPKNHPNTAGWHIKLLEKEKELMEYQRALVEWAQKNALSVEESSFFPHVTIARGPFQMEDWKETFQKRPFYLKNVHFYESLGHSRYASRYFIEMMSPFEEKEHMADLVFIIRGTTFSELFLHAALALSFRFLPLISVVTPQNLESLDDLIYLLNQLIGRVDAAYGCPFKAVSYHSQLEKRNEIMEWEMIVDV